MKAYVVVAETGEYSQREVWVVRVYTDNGKAEQYVLTASQEARAKYLQRAVERGHTAFWDDPEPRYSIEEVDLITNDDINA